MKMCERKSVTPSAFATTSPGLARAKRATPGLPLHNWSNPERVFDKSFIGVDSAAVNRELFQSSMALFRSHFPGRCSGLEFAKAFGV